MADAEFGFNDDTPATVARVVVQDDKRGDEPYFVYEVNEVGHVVATLGNFASVKEAVDAANVYASAAGLEVTNEVE